MTITDDPQEAAPHQPETGHVGHQLRRSREAHGLSVTQVADNQHLRPVVIQAIEDGHYEKIGNELFLKGYVKAYAEQVGLAVAPLLQQLDKELEPLRKQAAAAERESPLETIERKKRRKRRIAGWVLLILVATVIGYIGFQILENKMVSIGPEEPEAEQSVEESPATTPSASANDSQAPDSQANGSLQSDSNANASLVSEDNLAEGADSQSLSTQTSGGNSGSDTSDDRTSGGSENTEETSANTDSESSAGNESNADETDSTGTGQELAEASSETSASSTGSAAQADAFLRIEFSGNCWVSVENGAGEQVVASLRRSGENLRYRGEGPFRVVLGAADQASVWFNENAVDLTQYPAPNNRVALTLGQ